MRKWQQDLGGDTASASASPAESADRIATTNSAEGGRGSAESFTMTKFHWCALVFIGTFFLLVMSKPILVQRQEKDRLYEAPRTSYVTVATLSSLAALGYLLSLGAD